MPPMPDVDGKDLESLLRFLGVGEQNASVTPPVESEEGPYIFTGYRNFSILRAIRRSIRRGVRSTRSI